MRILGFSTLALAAFSFSTLAGCSGDDDTANTLTTGGAGGTGGASGGSGGTGAGTGGSASGAGGSTAGTAGSGAGTAGAAAVDYPTDMTQAGLVAFIDAMSHHSTMWAPNGAAPVDGTSPHARNQIWYNHTLRQSNADGHGATANPHTAGSMVVKDMYTADAVVGHAAMLRSTANNWIYYCQSSEAGRCFMGSMANTITYATTVGSCNCHGGGTIISTAMIPAP